MPAYNRDLLFLYGENARAKIKDLGVALKKSPQLLKHTLKGLEKGGIVTAPHCIFDYSYFGQVLFRVYFKGAYVSEHDKAEIISKLHDNHYIVSIYELSGEYDLVLEVAAPNPSRFNKELKKIASIVPTLNNYKILLNVVTHIYPRLYLPTTEKLLEHYVNQEIIIGGDRGVTSFTKNEMGVMKVLLQHPKTRMSHLAKATHLNIKTVTGILKGLHQRRIVKGYKYIVDPEKMGVSRFRLFLKLHNLSLERETQLLAFVMKTKEIVQVHKTVGDWDMEVDIESLDKTRIRSLTIQMREQFKDLIENFNIVEFYQYYKKTNLPMHLFEQEVQTTLV